MMTGKQKHTIQMLQGIPGFADILVYQLVEIPGNRLFLWLESKEGPCFLLARPEYFFPGYKVKLTEEDLSPLCSEGCILDIYVIVTTSHRPANMTANLMAPLVINREKGLGLQMIMYNSPYTTRHDLFPAEKRRHCG